LHFDGVHLAAARHDEIHRAVGLVAPAGDGTASRPRPQDIQDQDAPRLPLTVHRTPQMMLDEHYV